MKHIILALTVLFLLVAGCEAADVHLRWDAVDGATGYHAFMSVDTGLTWSQVGGDITSGTEVVVSDVPDNGLILFKVSAYNSNSESIREWSGAWYWGDLKPIQSPSGHGIIN